MSGFCSAHYDYEPTCMICAATPPKRRITIARDGAVKLRGVKTRWRVEFDQGDGGWESTTPAGLCSLHNTKSDARAYLEALTDEELLG